MVGLLDLSNELLLLILNDTKQEELENFTSVCKHIRSLGNGALKKHYEMKGMYFTILLGTFDEAEGYIFYHSIYLLRDILSNENVADYLRRVVISNCPDAENGSNHDRHWISIETKSTIASAIKRCPYIDDEIPNCLDLRYREKLQEAIFSGQQDTMVALLAALLPNLRAFEMENFKDMGDFLQQMVSNISYVHSKSGNGRRVSSEEHKRFEKPDTRGFPAGALGKLSHVHINRHQLNVDGRREFATLRSFAELPSIRSLVGENVAGINRGLPRLDCGFRLTNLDFKFSNIRTECFDNLLPTIPALEHFRYETRVNSKWYPGSFEPRTIIQILLRAQVDSLKTLHLFISGGPNEDAYLKDNYIQSLCPFCQLKSICVDNFLFAENHEMNGQLLPLEDCVVSIPEYLPRTTESLMLRGRLPKKVAMAMLQDIPRMRQRRLPQSSEIMNFRDLRFDKDVKASFEEMGIQLRVGTRSEYCCDY